MPLRSKARCKAATSLPTSPIWRAPSLTGLTWLNPLGLGSDGGGGGAIAYATSKGAVMTFTRGLAKELGPKGIRVNTLCPTFIRTPLTEPTFSNPERVKWLMEKIKLGRVGEVTDLMGPVVYLASDASAMMTGTNLLIDGGWTAD